MQPSRLVALLPLLIPACDSHEPGFTDEPVEIVFEGRVGGEPFACGRSYGGLGTDGASVTPQDFRFYVHDVRLVTIEGEEHPVTIEDDGVHQGSGVALIDFEDGSGSCANGTPSCTPRSRASSRRSRGMAAARTTSWPSASRSACRRR
ncbi:MbnP family protein [Nannocystis pusilla]|uniref:MbnP family protein n=1 Tax=Nannocystis pusilla TaxID=889268 RepID=UPI003B7A416C